MKIFTMRFVYTALFAFVLIALGTLGYMRVEGWPFMDSVYMSFITLTVGYGEL